MTNHRMKTQCKPASTLNKGEKSHGGDNDWIASTGNAGLSKSKLDNLLTRIISESPITVFAFDSNRVFDLCVGRGGEFTGLTPKDVIGQPVDIMSREVSDANALLPGLFSEETGVITFNFRGTQFDVWHTPLCGDDGNMKGVAGVAIDVTQRWQAQEKLHEEQLLLKQMLHFHERDTQLIAYEVHDGFVQDVTAAQMLLSSSLKSNALPPGAMREQIREASELVQKSIDEARRLIGGLRPAILEERGAVSAISYLIDNLPPNNIIFKFHADVKFNRLDALLEATIYRIVQQSINNILRHSRTDRAEIRLTQCGDQIHLEVQDWGIGFNPSDISEDRFGLQGIRERARLMRGRATIDSATGKGTRIIVDLPVA
jgi:PAS domain S-box-containing protein